MLRIANLSVEVYYTNTLRLNYQVGQADFSWSYLIGDYVIQRLGKIPALGILRPQLQREKR